MKSFFYRLFLSLFLLTLGAAAFLYFALTAPLQADALTEVYIVQLQDEPLASYRGGIHNLAATSAEVTQNDLDVDSSASRAYLNYLSTQQEQFKQQIAAATNRSAPFLYQYQVAFNGVALNLSRDEADQIRQWPNVKDVRPQTQIELLHQSGPRWIGADTIWDGTSTNGLPGTKGEGIIIGVLDTGIYPNHVAFADVGGDGYNHTNPWGSGQYAGVCNPTSSNYDPTFPCNDKLIGAWNFADGPRDNNGHGTNVASIAAANVFPVTILATTTQIPTTLSGVAPHANLIAYDVCYGGSCSESSTLAALDQVVLDGVDVLNISLGMGATNPWSSATSRALLGVREAGVFVAVAAGNNGPTAATINAPANAPWVVAVGNSNHGIPYASAVSNLSGGVTPPPTDLIGYSMSGGYGPARVVYAGSYGNPNCTTAFPAGTWQGEIVLCEGGNTNTTINKNKGNNVRAGGAGAVIITSSAVEPDWRPWNIHTIPAAHLNYNDGLLLKAWLTAGGVHTATVTGSYFPTAPNDLGDVMYTTSSRGPNPIVPDVLKPDLIAPGYLIQGAYHSNVSWANQPISQYTGSSQASPHVAGAAALLLALHPDWTPGQIQSALMTTALSEPVRSHNWQTPATPLDQGAGRADLTVAAQAGLLLDESAAKFAAANPQFMGDPTTLNLPSLTDSNCAGACQWTRTVSNALNETVTWDVTISSSNGLTVTVTPASFTLLPGASQTFTVTADANVLPNGEWVFAKIVMHNAAAQAPDAHFPIAVRPAHVSTIVPDTATINIRRDQGSLQLAGFQAETITDLTINTYGVVPAIQTAATLAQDATPNDPYDNLNDGATIFLTQTLPAATVQVIAEIITSAAPDVDLYVGLDTNMDGLPAAAELICASARTGWQERCILEQPTEGTLWIVAQNFRSPGPAAVTLALGVVTPDNNQVLMVDGPAAVPAYTPFALDIFWDLPAAAVGDLSYAVVELGTDAANPGNIGHTTLRLSRLADDVSFSQSAAAATLGDIITYTITIQPNLSPVDVQYTFTNTVPFGLQVDPTSVTGGATVVVHSNDTQIFWSGVLPAEGTTPVTLSYRATIDTKLCLGTLTTLDLSSELIHVTDNPGSVLLSETLTLAVQGLEDMCPARIDLGLTLSTDGSCGTVTTLLVEEGAPVTYCYTVTNVSPATLSSHDLEDNVLGTLLENWNFTLAPGASTSYTVTLAATQTAAHASTWTANNAAAAQSYATVTVNQTIQHLFIPLLINSSN